jgi:membrane-associated phospholipid phosphatase
VKAEIGRRSAIEIERARWWDVGGPAYRWNEIAVDEMLREFMVVFPASRNLALLHAAIDDAVAASWAAKQATQRPRPSQADPSIVTVVPVPTSSSYPSDHAAAAVAAAKVLTYAFPQRADFFASRAEEAIRSRVLAGVEYPSDAAAGRVVGEKAAALAIERGRADGSDRRWTGAVPVGPGHWQGSEPLAPLAGEWKPWVLSRGDEFRPPPPPAHDSDAARAALAELKGFRRTPPSNHRATYWEVFGGARAHALWNETARLKLLENGAALDPPTSARVLATLNVAFYDAVIACFDAKYAYWYIRPSQLDPELRPLFPPPNHPSYPAAHGCLSTAAATVLANALPRDRERLLAMGREAAEARVWAGIHYRFDIEAGEEIGRKVAEKALARGFVR